MFDLKITLAVEQFAELLTTVEQGMAGMMAVLHEGFFRMSEQSQGLLDAVAGVATRFDTLNATLQTEMAEIAAALLQASDADLRTAATDAVARLGTLQGQLDAMNVAIAGIIPPPA